MPTVVNTTRTEPARAGEHMDAPAAERHDAAVGDPVDAAWTLEALRSVWEHQHDRVHERIDLIERAIAALANDDLDPSLKREAGRAAHMLAGSLGMFGFVSAADAARSLESGLTHPTPGCAPELSALALAVRDRVRGPVTLRTGRFE